MDEKRKAPRFRVNLLVDYYPNREEYLSAEGMDLSSGGIRCRGKEGVDPLTNVSITIGIPSPQGEHLVRCEGYVAHARMEGEVCVFGITFERVFEEDLPYLERYLAELEGETPPSSMS
jgi:PilZ domain.